MDVHVVVGEGGYRVSGEGCADLDLVNAFLAHLSVRNFSVLTDEQWARIERLLPSSDGKQSRPFRALHTCGGGGVDTPGDG